ncbi:hypothetical protein BD560DRAFT_340839, partial [Blakeslea trispora]
RDAAARNFQPVSETQGFSFIYLPCCSKEPISNMREKLRKLKLQSSRLLDIHYSTNNVMSILVHSDYPKEITCLLQLQNIDLLQDFEPTSPTLLRDPKFDDANEAQRTAAATEIHQRRLINIALRIPVDQRKLSVPRSFLKQDWITNEHFATIN